MANFHGVHVDKKDQSELINNFTALIYYGQIISAVKQLIKAKNFDITSVVSEVKEFETCDGLEISMNYRQAHIVFRLFLDVIIPKEHCSALDNKAGLDKNKLSWKELVTLRILYIIFKELKTIIKNYVDVKQNYFIWINSFYGTVAEERHLR